MANWGIASGIGQGIMQGLQFNRQLDADKRTQQALENQTELLGMQKELHREKMGALTRENEDRLRTDTLDTLDTTIEANYQDRPDYVRKKMSLDLGASMGLLKPADIEKKNKELAALTDAFGETAVSALGRGDIGPMKSVLQTRGFGFDQDAKTGRYLVTPPGATAPIEYDLKGVLEATPLSGYRDRQAARAKAALDAQKTQAETKRLLADAGRLDRMPQEHAPGSGAGSGSGKGKVTGEYDPISTLEDFNKAIGHDPQTNQPYAWAPTALQHYQQIIDANPNLSRTKQGGQYALNLAMALGRGEAKAIPEIDANGNTKLIATWPGPGGQSPRTAVLQNNIDMSDPSMVQGVGGSPALPIEQWRTVQAKAVKSYALSRPAEYKLVVPIAADDAKLARLAAAAESDPNAARQYRFAKLIRSQLDQQASAPVSLPRKKPLTQDDAKVAAALGIDPEDPGLMGRISAMTNRFTSAISGFAKRSSEANVESQLRDLQRNPSDRSVREWLFARSVGNPELQAKIMAVLNKTAE